MQGFNMGRYVPPEQEGVATGNQLHRKRAPGTTTGAGGAQTVRFEMPFAVWCDGCAPPALIGQGVRFNAEKRRVGSYHSTPVWAFRLRHPACGAAIEIRTDPANTAYVVTEGGRKRGGDDADNDDSLVRLGPGPGPDGAFSIATEKERSDARESAFRALEKTIADRERLQQATRRIDELQALAERQWEDPYALNQRLRRTFRQGRKQREHDHAAAEDLQDRMSLAIELLPATEEDARRAALVDFRSGGGGGDDDDDVRVEKVLARPLFAVNEVDEKAKKKKEGARTRKEDSGHERAKKKSSVETIKSRAERKGRKRKAEAAAARTRESLVAEVVGNTRAAKDPFLDFGARDPSSSKSSAWLPSVKRKKAPDRALNPDPGPPPAETPVKQATKPALVGYNSDSD